jgi:hypothetical protein
MVRAALNWGTSVAALKEIAMMFNLSGGAQKMEVLFNWIRDSPHVTKISETEFEYRRPKTGASAGGKKIPMWILLTPEEVPSVDGVDMGTGAQISFFGPTNKENAVSGTRSNFLTSSANEFRGRSSGQSEIRRGRTEKPSCHHPGKMGIHPITAAVFFPPPISRARPKDYFDTQLTPTWFDWCTTASMYDTKPVYILSTAADCIEWIVKTRQVWDTAAQQRAIMKYLRLNVIEDYNHHMNSTDIADQLRGSYRPD